MNLTRGLAGAGSGARNVMKLNYTSLQHAVEPVEDEQLQLPLGRPVAVLALHGQLAAVAWAFAQAAPGAGSGYVQTEGGALPGGHSRTVARPARARTARGPPDGRRRLRGRGRGDHDGRRAAPRPARRSAGTRPCAGPGRGSSARARALGHGGMAALDSAHVALALGCPTLLVARMSSADERARHRGISHHTLTVLDLLLEPVTVALPAGMRSPVGADLRAGLGAVFGGPERLRAPGARRSTWSARCASPATTGGARPSICPRTPPAACPRETMGRGLTRGPAVLRAALAGGAALAELRPRPRRRAGPAPASGRRPARAARRRRSTSGVPRRAGRAGSLAPRAARPSTRAGSSRCAIERFRHADGEEVVARDRAPPGAVGDRRPRRAAASGWCASRARP